MATAPARRHQGSPSTKAPSILTFPLETGPGADYITAGGSRHIFVRNRQPAHGKMYLLQDETGTSPAVILFKILLTYKTFIPKKTKKYTRLIL